MDGNIALTDYENDRVWATRKVFNVLDYGAVAGGGSGGANKTAFSNALQDAGDADGGVVYVPAGVYDIDETSGSAGDGHLEIPANVTLEGVWAAPQNWDCDVTSYEGTVINIFETSAETSADYFLKLNGHNSSVKGITFYYPNQSLAGRISNGTDGDCDSSTNRFSESGIESGVTIGDILVIRDGSDIGTHEIMDTGTDYVEVDNLTSDDTNCKWEIYPGEPYTEYPWCIEGASYNMSIINVTIVNPYKAVRFYRDTVGPGRFLIKGLYGQPLNTGIQIEDCNDVGRIENVHFWDFWSYVDHDFSPSGADDTAQRMMEYQIKNSTALALSEVDWVYVLNFFCFMYNIGIDIGGTTNGSHGQFCNIGADQCRVGINVVKIRDDAALALLNYQYHGNNYDYNVTNGDHATVETDDNKGVACGSGNTGHLLVSSAQFRGKALKCIEWDAGKLLVTNTMFRNDGLVSNGIGIDITGSSVDAMICGNYFCTSNFSGINQNAVNVASGAEIAMVGNNLKDQNVSGVDQNVLSGTLGMSGNNIKLDNGYISNDGDNEGIRIDNEGSVGIGTATPSDKLEIYGNGADTSLRVHEDSGSNEAKVHLRSGTADWEFANLSGTMKCRYEDDEKIRINPDGDVGINETSPDTKLHITRGSGDYGCLLKLETDGNYDGPRITFQDGASSGKTWAIGSQHGSSADGVAVFENGDETGWGTERLSVKAGGNVGINETSPDRKLHIKDTSNPPLKYECSTDTGKSGVDLYIPIDVNGTTYYLKLYETP